MGTKNDLCIDTPDVERARRGLRKLIVDWLRRFLSVPKAAGPKDSTNIPDLRLPTETHGKGLASQRKMPIRRRSIAVTMGPTAQPKVTVVVKSYNHASYIRECIQSALDQDFEDFELVVTDDGSTDGTPEIIRQFSDPRIRLKILPSNTGISQAMNEAIGRSRGTYIAILNSDDFALPGRLAYQVKYLDAHPTISALFGSPLLVGEDSRPTGAQWPHPMPVTKPEKVSRTGWLRHFFLKGNCLCAPTAMIRRESYARAGAYDPRLTNLQDLDIWVRFLLSGLNIILLPEQFTAFRVRENNLNTSAPRPDTRLRAQFEFSRILRHYRLQERESLRQIFAPDIAAGRIGGDMPSHIWLSELALDGAYPAHKLFALETLYESAENPEDYRRLREMTGSLDLFGLLKSPG